MRYDEQMRGSAKAEHRRQRLRELHNRYTWTEIADRCEGINPAYLGQIASGVVQKGGKTPRALSDDYADRIERGLGLPAGWFDQDDNMVREPATPYPVGQRVPIISSTSAGNWSEIMDDYQPGSASDWLTPGVSVGPHAFALRIRGDSMAPTINDNAIVVVDPDAEPAHNRIVIARTNGHTESTCKRLVYDGATAYLRPDNERYPVIPVTDDTEIIGVVREVRMEL